MIDQVLWIKAEGLEHQATKGAPPGPRKKTGKEQALSDGGDDVPLAKTIGNLLPAFPTDGYVTEIAAEQDALIAGRRQAIDFQHPAHIADVSNRTVYGFRYAC